MSDECSELPVPAAYTPGQLEGLLDVPSYRGRIAQTLTRFVARISALRADVGWAWRLGHAPRLTLPRERNQVFIGRGAGCDCRLSEDTVSRRHALLLRHRDRWTVEDLGSRNGTRLNGWQVVIPTEVRAGDVLSFGAATYRVTSE